MKELEKSELMETDGGYWQAVLAGAGACIYVYNNFGDFVSGFKKGWSM